MDNSQAVLSDITVWRRPCEKCGRVRKYKTKVGFDRGKHTLCKSCSNSIKAGGSGYTGNCIDCGDRLDYAKSASLCFSCHVKRSNRYHMQTYRFSKYGVSREWYEKEAALGCAICKTPLSGYSLVKRERGHVDHDHITGKARGVLCDLCNKGLGQFKDSAERLRAAATYLEERGNE